MIAGIQKTTLIDFPPNIACTIFTSGCDFRCPFCHNPELVEGTEKTVPSEEFLAFLDSRKGLLDGVCITGGEPTIHGEKLVEIMESIKEKNLLVKLDTNGNHPEILDRVITQGLVDYFAMDLKSSKNNYSQAAGIEVNIERIEKSVDLIRESGVDHEFRTTVVPTLHGGQEIKEIIEWLTPSTIIFQKFRNQKVLNPELSDVLPYELAELRQLVGSKPANVFFRGFSE
jgi:pyruvate formate lyase activating enzyme